MSLKKIVFLAVVVRLLVTLLFAGSRSDDLLSFLVSGQILIAREPVYPSLYFPFFSYLGIVAFYIKSFMDQLVFLKLFFGLFDVGIVILVYRLSRSKLATVLYAVNPITLINTNIHGQFDTIPLFFLLLGIYLYNQKKIISSILSVSVGIWTKTWPALFALPMFRQSPKKWRYILLALFPALAVAFHVWMFGISVDKIIVPIKNYRGIYGWWGISAITYLLKPDLSLNIVRLIKSVPLLIIFLYSFAFPVKKIVPAVFRQMLVFFILTPTFGAQWLTWIVPFFLIIRPKYYQWFLASATVFLAITFYTDVFWLPPAQLATHDLLVRISGLAVWTTLILNKICYNKT